MTKPAQPTPFPLRMPDDLRVRIEELSRANGRSANAEILAILSAATGDTSGLRGVPVEALLKEAANRLGATVQLHVISAEAPSLAPRTREKKGAD